MEIVKPDEVMHVERPEGTKILYFNFPEYEIHHNVMPSGTIQPWHHHDKIEETIYMISGELEAHWIEDNQRVCQTLFPGDLARVEKTPHTFANTSSTETTFLVFRFTLTGRNKRQIFKTDKVLDQWCEIA